MSFLDESHSSLEREVQELELYEECSGNVPEWCSPHTTYSHEENTTPEFLKTDVTFDETNKKSKHKSKNKSEKHKSKEVYVPSTTHNGKKGKNTEEENDDNEEDEDDLPVFLREENNANNTHGSQNYHSSNYNSPHSNSRRSRSDSVNNNNNNNWQSNDSCLSLNNQSQSSGNGTADFLADIIESDNSTLPTANLNSNINNNNNNNSISKVQVNNTSTNVLKTSAEKLHFITLRQFEWKLKRIRILGKGSYGCATLYKVESFNFVEDDKDRDNNNKYNANKYSTSTSFTPTTTNNVFASLLENTHKNSCTAQSNKFHYTPTHNKLFAQRLLAQFATCPFVVVKDINVQTMQNRELEMAAIVTEVGIMSHLVQQNQFIQLYDFHELPEQMLYIICEYCSGGDLAALMECVQAKNVSLRQSHHHSLYGNRHSEKINHSIQACDDNKNEIGDGTKDRHNRAERSTNTKDPHAQKHKNSCNKEKMLEEEQEEKEVKFAGPRVLLEKYGLSPTSHSLMLPILQKIPLSHSHTNITNKRSSDNIHSVHVRTPKDQYLEYEEEEEEYKLYFSEEFIASVLIQLLLALHQLQMDEKVIHRDIKPHNLFIKLSAPPLQQLNNIHEDNDNKYEELIIRLADFGVAIQLASSSQGSISGATGSPYYMAPEVISETSYAFPADVWSLGVVLYELMSLQRPFQSISPSQLAKCITANQHIPLHDVEFMKSAFSTELLDLVESVLQVNPCARPLPLRLLRSHYVLLHLYTLPVTILVSLSAHLPSTTQKLINVNQSVNAKTNSNITVSSSSPSSSSSSSSLNILMSLFTNDVLKKAWEFKEKVIEQLSISTELNKCTTNNSNNNIIKAHLGQVNREDYWNEEYADDEFESEDD